MTRRKTTTRTNTQAEQKPQHHIYTHMPPKERQRAMALEQLAAKGSAGMRRTVARLSLPWRRQFGAQFLTMDCPVDASHAADDGEQLALQIEDDALHCLGGHTIGVEALLRHLADGDPKRFDEMLDKIVPNEPELERFYCFETSEDHREVGEDPVMTMALLGAAPDQVIRGVCIECESLAMAKQLAGQPGTRAKMNFREGVPRTKSTGRLLTTAWHGGWMTTRERVLGQTLAEQTQREQRQASVKKLNAVRKELGL